MTLYVLDTDTLVLFQEGDESVSRVLLSHAPAELAVSVITVEEQLSGWYTLLRRNKDSTQLARAYQRLADSVKLLSQFRILSFTESAIGKFEQLKSKKLGVKHMAFASLRLLSIVAGFWSRETSAIFVTSVAW